MLSSCIIHH